MKGEIKKVSVIIPNYNYKKYIKKRIMSAVKQSYPIYEIIVLDDASTDESGEVAKNIILDLKQKNPEMNIRFVGNEKNSGKAILQWKKGFELAKGDFVWIAEADDDSNPRFLEEVMKGFDDPEVVMSYTESRIINGAGVMLAPNFRWSRDKEKTGHYKKSYIKSGKDEIQEIMAIRCTVPNVSAVVFRKRVDIPYEKYLAEAALFEQVGDWYFYTKVLGHGKISYNRKARNYFRVHSDSVTGKSKNTKIHYGEIEKMHKMFEEEFELDVKVKQRMLGEREQVARRIKSDKICEGAK